MKRFFEIIIAFLMLVPISADAQSVGVVMSGGGAKGLYHIGVLRALEENGIPYTVKAKRVSDAAVFQKP